MRARATGIPVLCAGRVYCDLIFTGVPRFPSLGTEVFADGLALHAGGGAAITAAHLASLGHPSALSAMIPAAPFDQILRRDLDRAGVDLSACDGSLATADPQVTVAIVRNGERAFLSRRVGPACPPVTVETVTRCQSRHLHIGELATLIAQPELITAARDAGLTISVDCSWDDDLDLSQAAALLPLVDVFMPNRMEMDMLRTRDLDEHVAPLTVVKDGANGATATSADECVHVPTKPLDAIDTTGAGDAFNAGFLSAWLDQAPLRVCIARGHTQGARAIRKTGGMADPV